VFEPRQSLFDVVEAGSCEEGDDDANENERSAAKGRRSRSDAATRAACTGDQIAFKQ